MAQVFWHKKNKAYWIEYRYMGQRLREKVGPSRSQAETVLNKRKVQIAEKRFLDIKPDQNHSIDEIAKDFLYYSEQNKRSYWRDKIIAEHLLAFFKGRRLSQISPIHIEQYKGKRLNDGVKPSTVNRELAVLKSMFNWAIKSKKATDNPVRQVKFFHEPNPRLRFLDKNEIARLMANSADHLKPILIMALTTGMRRGEILDLKWENVLFDQGLVMIEHSKSGKRREIPICGLLTRTLKECFNSASGRSEYVFSKPDGQAIKKVRTAFEAACRRAKIDNFHFHDLRHTAASYLVMSGIDLVTVKEILGHAKIEMTMRYAHLSKVHKQEAMEILGSKMDANMDIKVDTQVDTKPKKGDFHDQKISKTDLKINPFRQGSSVVEHWSEKPGVESSILSLGISLFAEVAQWQSNRFVSGKTPFPTVSRGSSTVPFPTRN